jgi:hypothetical protein
VPIELGARAVVAYRGYRCIGSRASTLWDAGRRKKYLIVPEVRLPISIDTSVTPEAEPIDEAADKVELMGVAMIVEGDGDLLLDQWRFPEISAAPSPIGEDWLLLGHDVCDQYNTSALSNCAPADPSSIGGFWRLALNQHHLFGRVIDADAFRKSSDRRIPEHAPFVVMAVLAHSE